MPLLSMADFRETLAYKIIMLIAVFPTLAATIAIDRFAFTKSNPFLSIPRDTTELRRDKVKFFLLLQSGKVRVGCGGESAPQLVPKEAIMVYVDVKDGCEMEPDKNRGVARVDVAFRMPAGSEPMKQEPNTFARFTTTTTLDDGTNVQITVLRLFIKMTTARRWPILFKALIATFSPTLKEVAV
eukprot:PhF_6_TR25985/c0_g1_i1/m.36638